MERPSPPEQPKGSFLSIFLAAILGLMAIVALAFLTLGWALGPILLGAGVFAVAAFHYLTWGWWLSKSIREEAEEEERRNRPGPLDDRHP